MVASADGATAVAGRSGGLSCPADHALFNIQRALADAVLVAAGTMRAERYGPVELTTEEQNARRTRGQTPLPPIAVVSRSCDLDWDSPFFTEAVARPIVLTAASAPADRREAAAQVSDLIVAGDSGVDPGRALDELGERGIRSLAAEGGPTLNGLLSAAGVIDDLCLTVSPLLAGGSSKRILSGDLLDPPAPLTLASACREGDFLFLRYLRA